MSLGADQSGLDVIAVVSDHETQQLLARTLAGGPDRLILATDLAEGLARVTSEAPDVVLVEVAMGQSAGLAVVHHVRALAPDVSVLALVPRDRLELGTQAVALGGLGLLMMPLSGDELLTALSEIRTRRAERQLRLQLEREAAVSKRGTSLVNRIAEITDAATRREAAGRLADALVEDADADVVLVYLAAGEGSREMMLAAQRGDPPEPPSFGDDMELLTYAGSHDLDVVRLALKRAHQGLILVRSSMLDASGAILDLLAAQATTALALLGEQEQSQRGAMKDPESSAYTFAYFVDVAGREIDKARRHGRRFALATISLPGEGRDVDGRAFMMDAIERMLAAVRDTDVLARVDDREFYLLLPETGGMGAHSCRRRVMRELNGPLGASHRDADIMMGVATFPHDGKDLTQLLRMAKHRADSSRNSIVRRLGLERMRLGELIDGLLWAEGDDAEVLQLIELPARDVVALSVAAVSEALRGGKTWVVASQKSGLSIGAAVKSALSSSQGDVRLDAVDVATVPGCEALEVMCVVAEHGAYSLLGRVDGDTVRAAHSADPLFADLIIERLGEETGTRLLD